MKAKGFVLLLSIVLRLSIKLGCVSYGYYALFWCGTMLSLGCSNFKGPSSSRWIWHQVFWDGKSHYGTYCSCWAWQNCWYVFNKEIMLMQSAKTNMNVDEVFFSIARDIKQRLADNDSKTEVFVLNFLPSDDECILWQLIIHHFLITN